MQGGPSRSRPGSVSPSPPCTRFSTSARFAGTTVADYLGRVPAPVVEIHVHDNNGRLDEHRHPGQGTVPFADVAEALRSLRFSGVSTLEVAPSLHKGDPAASFDLVPQALRQWDALLRGR